MNAKVIAWAICHIERRLGKSGKRWFIVSRYLDVWKLPSSASWFSLTPVKVRPGSSHFAKTLLGFPNGKRRLRSPFPSSQWVLENFYFSPSYQYGDESATVKECLEISECAIEPRFRDIN